MHRFGIVSYGRRHWHSCRHHRCLSSAVRKSGLNIQLIPESLRRLIFGSQKPMELEELLAVSRRELRKHKLWDGQRIAELSSAEVKSGIVGDFNLPPLEGKDVAEHFHCIGAKHSNAYKTLADSFCGSSKLPAVPKLWEFTPGWTKYHTDLDGNVVSAESVPYPTENALVFDVEVCMNDGSGDKPTVATAVSSTNWYSWCSTRLCRLSSSEVDAFEETKRVSYQELIPMGESHQQERLIIGHNVGFDRSFIKEQYHLEGDRTRFMDTMSLHIAIAGLTGYQRALSFSYNVAKKTGLKDYDISLRFGMNGHPDPKNWENSGSLNNLVDVYKFHCGGEISKESRDLFVKGSLNDIRSNYQRLVGYCANDVKATYEVFCQLWKLFPERFPHPVTLAGMLEMSVMYLPVNCSNWNRYVEESQGTYDDKERELTLHLQKVANEACSLLIDEKYKKDVWLWDLDWSTQELRFRKNFKDLSKVDQKEMSSDKPKRKTKAKSSSLDDDNQYNGMSRCVKEIVATQSSLRKVQPFLPGYPAWYRELCAHPFGASKRKSDEHLTEWEPGPSLISTQMRSVPKLLRLMWKGFALHYDAKEGWGYLVPPGVGPSQLDDNGFPLSEYMSLLKSKTDKEDEEEHGRFSVVANCVDDFEVQSRNEFDPLTKQRGIDMFGCKFYRLPHKDGPDSRVGNPLSKEFLRYLEDSSMTSYSNQSANIVLELSKALSYWKMNNKRIYAQMVVDVDDQGIKNMGALLPRVVVAGTITRRAVEPTWLTASNAYEDRIGSELKAMIQAPPGYKLVGADVDSEEMWIASLIGDSYFGKMHGCTAMGWMTLQGTKAEGTDVHSKVANLVGISRHQAKILNYGRIYGAGKAFAARFLKLSNPQMSDKEARNKAAKIYRETKGVRKQVIQKADGDSDSQDETALVWHGGSESPMFNKLEKIAMSEEPATPVLGCKISTALLSMEVRREFITSIVNWVVQSSAVDYLHFMLVSMKWLFDYYQIKGRFSISIHDEVRYLVAEEDSYKTALALQISNLLTRSMFAHQLGIHDLPESIAYFSRVDIDSVLRKEVDMDCKTPSNPHGLRRGYGIPFGTSLDMKELLQMPEIRELLSKTRPAERRPNDIPVEQNNQDRQIMWQTKNRTFDRRIFN